MALWEDEPLNLYQLGTKLHLASNTLTPLLRRLETNGWITRSHPAQDKRQLIVGLTQAGKDLKPKIEETLAQCVRDSGGFSRESYRKLLDDNQELIANLRRMI